MVINNLLFRWAPVLSLAFFIYALPVSAAPPVVILDAALTRVSDGSAPFATIDPVGDNGDVASLDSASYTFDVNVDRNDGQTHTISNWTIVGTLSTSPSTTGVRWQVNSLPSVCGTKTVSADGTTITCVLSGTYPTGTTQNISAAWFAESSVANGTDVTTSFTVSADMVADASGADNPVDVSSNQDSLNIVSQPSDYEVRKTPGTVSILRDANSEAEFVQVDWGIQVEVKSPETNQVKGISTSSFGDISLGDLVASGDVSQQPVQQDGELVSCMDVPATSILSLAYSRSNSIGDATAVQDSGTWTCDQAGGVGTDISVSATGIKWAPDWFTLGHPAYRSQYWSFNSGTSNDTYNSPSGQNNQAVVATQVVRMKYPYATVVAFDGTAGDRDTRTNIIEWCNDIGNIDVVGATDGVDSSSNNQNCAIFQNITGLSNSTSKRFTKYQGVSGTGPDGTALSELVNTGGDILDGLRDGSINNYSQAYSQPADLGVNISLQNEADVVVGADLLYDIEITNNGPYPINPNILDGSGFNPIATAFFTLIIPGNLTYVSNANDAIDCFGPLSYEMAGTVFGNHPGSNFLVCSYSGPITSLESGQKISTTITATANTVSSSFTNHVFINGASSDPDYFEFNSFFGDLGASDIIDLAEATGSNNYASHTFVVEPVEGADVDSDGILDTVEAAGPNGGDANDDNTADYLQANVAALSNAISGEYTVLEVANECVIQSVSMISETQTSSTPDPGFNYPSGLMDFSIDCGVRDFQSTIKHYYFGAEGSFTMRKFHPSSGYSTIKTATTSSVVIDNKKATMISYSITDGGELDADSTANGIIKDPAGLGVNVLASPNTGISTLQ